MDPIDRLRALREDSRWTPAEFELDASPASMSRPVRGRRVSGADAWRHWLPRVGLGALAAAAVVGLVVAAVNAGLGAPAPAPNVAGPIASSSSEPKPASTATTFTCGETKITGAFDVPLGMPHSFQTQVVLHNIGAWDCILEPQWSARWVSTGLGLGAPTIGAPAESQDNGVPLVIAPGASAYAMVQLDNMRAAGNSTECASTHPAGLEARFADASGVVFSVRDDSSVSGLNVCSSPSIQQTGALPLQTESYLNVTSAVTPPCDWSQFVSKLTVGGHVGGVTLAEVKFTYAGANTCNESAAEPTVRWVVASDGKTQRVGNASSSAMPDVASTAEGRIVTPGMSSYARIDIDDQGLFATGDCIGPTPNRLEFVFDGWGAGSSTAIDYIDASLVTSPCAASSSVHLLTYQVTYQSTLQRDVLERQAAEAAKQAAAEAAHHAATTAPTGH
jgi:hypothetical protein